LRCITLILQLHQQQLIAPRRTEALIFPTNASPDTTNYNQGINVSHAGSNEASHQGNNCPTTMFYRLLEPFPNLIQGTQCYMDASTQSDLAISLPGEAEIDIFIINTQMSLPLTIFIKATMQDSTSVLMVETVALALAIVLLKKLELQDATLLSDNQQLVHFLNGADLSNPPVWRIKPYTQIISSLLADTSSSICKTRRS